MNFLEYLRAIDRDFQPWINESNVFKDACRYALDGYRNLSEAEEAVDDDPEREEFCTALGYMIDREAFRMCISLSRTIG